MTNSEVSKVFKLLGNLMILHGENAFKAKSYSNAAFQLSRLSKEVSTLSSSEIDALPGVGKAISDKIALLLDTGELPLLTELLNKTPKGILEILNIKGLGPSKVKTIWEELGIENVGELLYACYENRLALLKGFGEKTQTSVIQAIEFYNAHKNKFHFATLDKLAKDIVAKLKTSLHLESISLTGAIRRKANTLDQLELIIGIDNTNTLESILNQHHININNKDNNTWTGNINDQIPIRIYICTVDTFTKELFLTTGNKEHLALLNIANITNVNNENEIYQSIGLPYIEPELREGKNEIAWAKENKLPILLEVSDIKGMLHNHSTYSDGQDTLEAMATYCKELGYEYLGICDHSQTAVYAGGLKPDKIIQQHKEIDQLNSQLAPFKIFKGIESDILNDGSLDYTDEVLASFDFIVASVHSNLKMNEDKATARLIKAIENPYTTILGHPTGRLLLYRAAYPIDHKKVIDACATNNVIIELNANPYRLDIDWAWIPYAIAKGVKISINPDAHKKTGYHDTYFGVCSARKGGLIKEMTFNNLGKTEIENYFIERKQKI